MTPTPVRLDGRLVGHLVEAPGIRLCRLAGLRPANTAASPAQQAAEVFERMTRALTSVGMALGHVRRTWFYNDDLLAWYGAFNAARAACFTRAGVDREHPPASTGIGAPNLWGAVASATEAPAAAPPAGRSRQSSQAYFATSPQAS